MSGGCSGIAGFQPTRWAGKMFLLKFGCGGVGWRGEDGTDPVSGAKELAEHDAAPP
jgi:hypothetical protein